MKRIISIFVPTSRDAIVRSGSASLPEYAHPGIRGRHDEIANRKGISSCLAHCPLLLRKQFTLFCTIVNMVCFNTRSVAAVGLLSAAFSHAQSQLEAKSDYWDVIVLGGGSTGTFSAIRLQQQGLNVALIEKKDRLGGQLPASNHEHRRPC